MADLIATAIFSNSLAQCIDIDIGIAMCMQAVILEAKQMMY